MPGCHYDAIVLVLSTVFISDVELNVFLEVVNSNNNNNYGNFICVFECTTVNLATYRQFTNAA